jgi:hypothetical protein
MSLIVEKIRKNDAFDSQRTAALRRAMRHHERQLTVWATDTVAQRNRVRKPSTRYATSEKSLQRRGSRRRSSQVVA